MPELQPWRNPPPAPHLSEIQARLRPPRVPAWLRAWWPAAVWAGLIFSMSTDMFSAEHTGSILEPILRWLIPSLTKDQFQTIHYSSRNILSFACCSIAAFAATTRGGAGRGALRHSSAPRDIPSWMKFTKRSSPAAPLRLTIRCSTRLALSPPSACCGNGSTGGDPQVKRK